jgi:carboxymethylenebutenolidase
MIEQTVEIPAREGAITTFISHPERDGPHPVVVLFMDGPGVREELRDMARRLASVGYYAMLPNLYRRQGVLELADLPLASAAEARRRAQGLMGGLVTAEVMDDADRLLAFADQDAAASPGRAGCVGYCMSGSYAVNFAARHPERIGAAASICGSTLVSDRDDSPHLALRRATAEFYFCCAEHDDWTPLAMVDALERAARAHKPISEVEIFPGVRHGFCFASRPIYDRESAERHWERIFSLFQRRLKG